MMTMIIKGVWSHHSPKAKTILLLEPRLTRLLPVINGHERRVGGNSTSRNFINFQVSTIVLLTHKWSPNSLERVCFLPTGSHRRARTPLLEMWTAQWMIGVRSPKVPPPSSPPQATPSRARTRSGQRNWLSRPSSWSGITGWGATNWPSWTHWVHVSWCRLG